MQTQTVAANDAVIKEVRWRFRICNYLFNTGAAWMGAGYAIAFFTKFEPRLAQLWLTVVLVGFGIFSAAFALTLAIYRCPVCDKYLSRFRPDKRKCPQCGTQVRLTLTGRP
jgi:ssDNA-binding Zn-finger/Zn-ribbon topoisomerase 1